MKINKRRITLILPYRGFRESEAKENQSDYVSAGVQSSSVRGNEWANLEVSRPHTAGEILLRKD